MRALADDERVTVLERGGAVFRIEAAWNELDAARLLVGQRQQLILEMRDSDVARAASADRVRPLRPHLRVMPCLEHSIAHVLGKPEVLPALDRDDLVPARVLLLLALPD